MNIIDKIAYENRLSDVSSTIKFFISILLILVSLFCENVYLNIAIAVSVSIATVFAGGVKIKVYLRLLRIPLYFIVFSLIAIIISAGFEENIFIHSIKVGSVYIGITKVGIAQGKLVFSRAFACLCSIYFFNLSTPFIQIIDLLKKTKIQSDVLEIIILMYRFIFIFIEEFEIIRTSQQLRMGYNGLKNSYRSSGILMKSIYERMMARYEELKIVMDLRLFEDKFHI